MGGRRRRRAQQLVDGDEVAEALRHLLAFDLQEAVVHPDVRHARRAEGAARLGDFVLVMREDEVDAAAVNVEDVLRGIVAGKAAAERLQQQGHRHRRAFDMPARSAGRSDAAGARPSRLVRLGGLPQHEVHRVALVGRDVDAGAGQHLVERAPRQRAVTRDAGKRVHRARRKQHMILGDIGDAARRQPLDQGDHLGDMSGRARLIASASGSLARRRPHETGVRCLR